MIIKVCGMRDAQNIRDVAGLDIDMMGFNFWPGSKRFVKMISSQAGILPDYSPERLDYAVNADGTRHYIFPKSIKRVGVFVDEMPQTIVTTIIHSTTSSFMATRLLCLLIISGVRWSLISFVTSSLSKHLVFPQPLIL